MTKGATSFANKRIRILKMDEMQKAEVLRKMKCHLWIVARDSVNNVYRIL